jgi:ppGpp synthetase/RelA/SpoT-type nucleotidyltranferase
MPLTDQQILECQERYVREIDRYTKMAEVVYEQCLDIVQKKLTVRATVQRRAKTSKSFVEKLRKEAFRNRFDSVEQVFQEISDLAGVRIATYLESDREMVVEEIRKEFSGPDNAQPRVDVKDRNGAGRHYKATHCQVFLADDVLIGSNENLRGTTCEIQVCSLLAHVFNEIEHDLQYKPLSGQLSAAEKEFIDQLGLLTKAGDITIKRLLQEAESRLMSRTGPFADVYDFIARMREELGLPSFASNAGQLFEELTQLEMMTPEAVTQCVRIGHGESLSTASRREFTALKEFMRNEQRQMDLLEDDSSDVLLVGLLGTKLDRVLANHPMGRGVGRPSRLAQIASAYRRMRDAQAQ